MSKSNQTKNTSHYGLTSVKVDAQNNEIKRTLGNQSEQDILNWFNG